MLCPCGSGKTYTSCCAAFHEADKSATQAEQLMRSRYSAYVLENYDYILNTYGADQQKNLSVEELAQSAQAQKWIKLIIHQSNENSLPSTVEFSAYFLIDNVLHELREHSRFRQEQGTLKYIDGDILVNDKIATISRNDSCPCGSNKKFKKCCAK